MSITVLTVDDHAVVRAGIRSMLEEERDIVIAAEASDGHDAVRQHALVAPDVVLMDLRMPRLDGVAAIRAIRAADPRARIVALTMYDGDVDIHRALSAGACGYLLKEVSSTDLAHAVREAAAGRRVVPTTVARTLAESMPRVDLTPREEEVLRLVAKGLRNREVARVINRTEGTIKSHLRRIHEKLGVDDRTEAVMLALRRGILHLDD